MDTVNEMLEVSLRCLHMCQATVCCNALQSVVVNAVQVKQNVIGRAARQHLDFPNINACAAQVLRSTSSKAVSTPDAGSTGRQEGET
eukprot:15687708-Heterocapsa_arctica.AAC.1